MQETKKLTPSAKETAVPLSTAEAARNNEASVEKTESYLQSGSLKLQLSAEEEAKLVKLQAKQRGITGRSETKRIKEERQVAQKVAEGEVC
jgi:hypothetical protein